ncbi:MAG TPA: AAA family ATPase [Candidatus Dormibacteraeota bacterium]|nr:AAA family ATPase [Candidatus Dormibacteraeota bacterium]
MQSPALLFPGVTLDLPEECLDGVGIDRLRCLAADGCVVAQPVAGGAPAAYGTVARLDPTPIPGGVRVRGVLRVHITGGWTLEGAPAVAVETIPDVTGADDVRLARAVRDAALAKRPGSAWAAAALTRTDDPARIADVTCQLLFASRPELAAILGEPAVATRLRWCARALGVDVETAAPPPDPAPVERTPLVPARPPLAPVVAPAPAVAEAPPPPPPPAPVRAPVEQQWSNYSVRPDQRPTPPREQERPRPPRTPAADGPSGKDAFTVRVRPPSQLRTFADVGGMDKLKRELHRSIGILVRQPDAVRDLDYHFSGLLLHGPPGVGKSYIAEAAAGEFGMSFCRLSIGEVLSHWLGDSEKRLREAFSVAAIQAPCILFLDEFDAVAARRAQGGRSDSFDRRLLDQLLLLLDDAHAHPGVLVIAATNDVQSLEPSAIREGRFDRQIFVDVPDRPARRAIFATHLRGRRTDGRIDLDDVADRSAGLTAAAVKSIVVTAAGLAIEAYEQREIPVAEITNPLLDRAIAERRGRDCPMLEPRGWDELVLAPGTIADLQRLVRMLEAPDEMRRRGLKPVTGALLWGPPGTGKSTIARVIASQTDGAVNFYPVRGSDLLTGTLGSSPARVRDLFERARQYAPSVIFLDEADAILHRRGVGHDSASQERDTVIAEFLGQMDGLSTRPGVFVLAATNLPDTLDPAVLRSGRLTRIIEIPLPELEQRVHLFRLFTRGMRLGRDVDLEGLARICRDASGADIEAVCAEAGYQTLDREGDVTVRAVDFAAALSKLGRSGVTTLSGSRPARAAAG